MSFISAVVLQFLNKLSSCDCVLLLIVRFYHLTDLSVECMVQMAELREENTSLMKQLDSAHDATRVDIVRDTEFVSKVDKNANLQLTHVSDESSAADVQQLESSEADKEQVVML